ncbi:hypothetical protein BGZ83_005417 [Gryganskiella cystojenkinii]|nr:hypothetical protein BGZ83_005417 [Gryganskiella cystojenkinii]
MSHQIQRQGYIQIEEDRVSVASTASSSSPVSPRVVQLRNVAYTRPSPDSPRITTRSQVLESLMPMSRAPWGQAPSIMVHDPLAQQRDQQSRRHSA